ncbi:MAG: hypothetical protein EZS28_050030 [Streblomastix strix]|uniref:Uncharacterized protein n=1 Tax=Streblomastix strix TaxID=222440 RepID=A0A5J4T7U1_9EUKA|nr:MAG: hypothetical protein EZS28_050030 [Streblomastix strix]
MMTGPAMVYKLNEQVKQVPNPWTVQPMPNQGTKNGKSKKLFTTWKDSSIAHGLEVEKGKMFLTLIFRQDRTFQRSLTITHQWIEIRDLETLTLGNENIGKILLRTRRDKLVQKMESKRFFSINHPVLPKRNALSHF